MLEKLADIKKRYDMLSAELSSASDFGSTQYIAKAKEYDSLTPLIDQYASLELATQAVNDITEWLVTEELDEDTKKFFESKLDEAKSQVKEEEEKLKLLLLPKDENDSKNIILEIRAGVGGDESALFANDLLRMYKMYCDRHDFNLEILNIEQTEIGGIKEVQAQITGKNVYANFKYESGVHRVQRVPETESQGRVHTSAATVAVLPEMEDTDVEINDKDIRIDLYRASGAGGQHINKTESAIRITHFPSGIVVTCQSERSQIQNKEKAFAMLRTKLYDYYQSQKEAEYRENRKIQVGSGDRSERIRTYNFPQGRVTDHRINFSLHNIESFMNGDLDELIEKLTITEQQLKLANIGE
ncbi:peptide chain release factor 1 [uncultured Clostridium sp.]|uniref:peptide chain release factor 1 n=1 Tax=uncultured Clostridium sp. TaxID=59620 RepID=UPI002636FEE5|nr:peptide chain release factor 1 [uncultured Clostridium sp.]